MLSIECPRSEVREMTMTERILNDRYALESKVGEGGMAVTYRARDLLLNRTVAVKLMREQFTSDPQFVERFRREAQAAARLSHQHIANVYDTGRANGTYYIVMEFVEGIDLKQRLRRDGALTVLNTLQLGQQIAGALDAAHRNGLVHRDIKPHNILLTTDGKVKVTDFGIAKLVSEGEDTGVIIGSVHYLSPEQARGEATTPSSDLYALGAVLFEMLTGRTVFEGENAMAVAHKQIYDRPPLLRTLRPEIPAAVESMVLRCLEKDPRARYVSAAELEAVLAQLISQLALEETVVIQAPSIPAMDATMVYRPPTAPVATPPRRHAPPPPPETPVSSGGRVTGWVIALLFIALAGAVSYGVFLYLGDTGVTDPGHFRPTNTVTVPDISSQGLDPAQVTPVLAKLGLEGQPSHEFSETVPEGKVCRQEPIGGTRVDPKKTMILYWVSDGPAQFTMPDVSQMTMDAAKTYIKSAGYKGTFGAANLKKEDSALPKGSIVRSEPAAGQKVDRNGPVILVLSTGKAPITPTTLPVSEVYHPGVSAEDIARDLGTDSIYVRYEIQRPSDADPQLMDGVTLQSSDTLPEKSFTRKVDEAVTISLLAAKDNTSPLKSYEKKIFGPGDRPTE